MTEEEYLSFYRFSGQHHAEELVREERLFPEEAKREAERELSEMLPDGLDTADNYLMVIENSADGRRVGFIWFLFEIYQGKKQSFICDLMIEETERRKGYAAAALNEAERTAETNGCAESVLFVSNANIPARMLYSKCGYVFLRNTGHGMYLVKKLKGEENENV